MNKVTSASVLVLVLGLLSFTAAHAEGPFEKGAFVGVGGGITSYDDDNQFRAVGGVQDDEDRSLMVYGGYKFFKYLSVEGRLAGLGEYKVDNGGGSSVAFDYTALTGSAVGHLPFGDSGWELFGQAGVGLIFRRGEFPVADDEGGVITIGGGVRWTPVTNFSVALAIDGYGWIEEGVARDYNMSIGTSRLMLQLNF